MKLLVLLLISTGFLLFSADISCNEAGVRSAIEYNFADAQIVTIDSELYFSWEVMATATGIGTMPRLGTGMVVINYNTAVFGEWVCANSNTLVTRGALLTTSPIILYNMIVNDNQAGRLAITFEYTSASGGGNLLADTPQQLVNVKLRILQGGSVGLSFAASYMNGEQYQDNNTTLLSPVIADDTENSVITCTPPPTDLSISISNNILLLTWQGIPGCIYNIYSANNPDSETWQTEEIGVVQTHWSCTVTASRRFYYVSAQRNSY
jgi:hypothetical protein